MATAFIENIEAPSSLNPQHPADTALVCVTPGSSEMRSYLLDGTLHVVYLWDVQKDGEGEGPVMTVSDLRSFGGDGVEEEPWKILSTRQLGSRHPEGVYTQTYLQPESSLGKRDVSWIRIPRLAEHPALFAAPNAMPRDMGPPVSLEPAFVAQLTANVPQRVGHLSLVQ